MTVRNFEYPAECTVAASARASVRTLRTNAAVHATAAAISALLPVISLAATESAGANMALPAVGGTICVLDTALAGGSAAAWAQRLTAAVGGEIHAVFDTAIKGFSFRTPIHVDEHIARLHVPVRYCEPNGRVFALGSIVANGPKSPIGSGGKPRPSPSGQVVPAGVTRIGGPEYGGGRSVWIVDTGVDLRHRDLVVGFGANFVRDARGRLSGTANDGNGHGTHVAGTVAAIDNQDDVVGVAAGATVHPVRVLDDRGNGQVDWVVAGLDFVAANAMPGDVVNLSLGASGHFQSLHDAVIGMADRGIRVSIAAGNAAAAAADYEPAHVEHPNVYTVSAVDNRDRFAAFSNFGNPPIDWAAPGVDVLSLRAGGGTVAYSGTSMAAPHIAGILLLSNPRSDGEAIGDVDGVPDPIGHY